MRQYQLIRAGDELIEQSADGRGDSGIVVGDGGQFGGHQRRFDESDDDVCDQTGAGVDNIRARSDAATLEIMIRSSTKLKGCNTDTASRTILHGEMPRHTAGTAIGQTSSLGRIGGEATKKSGRFRLLA
jgi:hypothetical protein